MSKSTGNIVAPQEIIKQYGADILRIWVVASDYSEDLKLGPISSSIRPMLTGVCGIRYATY